MPRTTTPPVRWRLVTVASDARESSDTGRATTQVGVQVIGSDDVRVPGFLRGLPGAYEVIQQWDRYAEMLAGHDPFVGHLLEAPELLSPLRYPRKVLCSGPNFRDHLAEMGESSLGDQWNGYFFFKPPTTTLIGPRDAIEADASWASDRIDWEGELAVVISRGGRNITPAAATEHIAGYCVANDISLRGPHRRDTPAAPFVWDWVASKAADTSLPLGPGIVPAWQVPDTGNLSIRTWVNSVVKQDGTTADMVLDVARLISDASRLLTLEPGDVILTGTPAGVGAGRGTFLAPGDVVEVEIEGIGRLSNIVRLRHGV